MSRWLVCGVLAVLLGAAGAFGKPGVVMTRDGKTYEGNVVERGDVIEVSGVPGQPGPMQFRRGNVKVVYPDVIAAQVHAALGQLDQKDVQTRVKMAREAMDDHAYDAAREALGQALAIDPQNKSAKDLLAEVNRRSPPATQATTHPATAPTTRSTNDMAQAPHKFIVKREVTAAEVNRIRQIEWRKDDPGTIAVRVDQDVRRKFLVDHPDMRPAEFAQLSPQEQAAEILSKGKPELWEGVHIRTDPPVVMQFKKPTVQHAILIGCAAASCHGGAKSGDFRLYSPPTNDLATYTNFLTLQKYKMTINGTERYLVDRQFPDQSLLLQFMLPLDVAETPHPKVRGFKGMSRTKSDAKYQDVLAWIQNLNPVAPQYGIDLSKPPKVRKPVKTRAQQAQ